MQQVVPWKDLVALITPYAPEGRKGRPAFPVEMLLRIHFMPQWFTLSDLAIEEALHDMPLFRDFPGLSWDSATPDESTILRFRHLLEQHKIAEQILQTVNELLEHKKLLLCTGTIVDATLIAAPTSTKNQSESRDE
jgi:IS5 family transposase